MYDHCTFGVFKSMTVVHSVGFSGCVGLCMPTKLFLRGTIMSHIRGLLDEYW